MAEYCATRAKPNVESSDYLQTLGKKLHKNIHIMWTGPKVVSQSISPVSIEILANVLQRKPVIWDNIHANDYDQRRVYLGPYKGRSMELYNCTSGILTNPNCEYECNFIAVHSLSTWLKNSKCFSHNKDLIDNPGSLIEEKMVTENTADETGLNQFLAYDSNTALTEAVKSWMELFQLTQDIVAGSKLITTRTEKVALSLNINSLINDEALETESIDGCTNKITTQLNIELNEKTPVDLQAESVNTDQLNDDVVSPKKKARSSSITIQDILLLCDLFHLPYEHGERGKKIISDFKWLKENAIDYKQPYEEQKINAWMEQAKQFHESRQTVEDLFNRLSEISNRRLLQQLYPYIYDVKEVVNQLSSYVKWLGGEERKKGSGFLPADPEPWMFRGGIAEEMERLLPSLKTSASEGAAQVKTIRPYLPQDKSAIYQLCTEMSANPTSFNTYPDLPGDSTIGPYIKYSPENIFVIETDDKICGVVAANSDAAKFYAKLKDDWLPSIRANYKKPDINPNTWTIEDELVNRLYNPQFFIPDELLSKFNAVVMFHLQAKVKEICIARQLFKCIFSLLKANIYCKLPSTLTEAEITFYKELGFTPITLKEPIPKDIALYGHTV